MTSAATAMSAVRVHHDADEIRQGVASDRLRLMATYARGYSVTCDCSAGGGRLDIEDCAGLRVHNRRGNPVAVFRGGQYRAIANPDRTLSVYSTLVRN